MEEYDYLENLSKEELIHIVEEMLDYEEVAKALIILEDKDVEKTVELGYEIIVNNQGDDYLQATTWDVTFEEDNKKMLEALEKRREDIGKVLLNDIIDELIVKKITVSEKIINRIKEKYMFFYNKSEKELACDYQEFCHMYLD